MGALEICLVVIGLIFVLCSFLFSEHLLSGETKDDAINGVNVASVTEEIVKREVEAEVANIIDDRLDDMELKAEKLTSEKLMAMGEFSDDILKRITQNHEEVMFLYNMLNDKEEVLKNTIRDIEAVKASVKKMAIVNDVAHDVSEKQSKAVGAAKEEHTGKVSGLEPELRVEAAETQAVKLEEKVEEQSKAVETKKPVMKEQATRKREISNNNQMILKLYSQGKTNIEIAKELGLGIGEVRLVIDLFNSR